MILNRTIVDTQRQEASPINQTDDTSQCVASLLKGKTERKKSIFSKMSRGSKSRSLGNEENTIVSSLDTKSSEIRKLKKLEKEHRKLSTKSYEGSETVTIKKPKKYLFIKRQSMTEGVYPQSRESLQLPAIPKFGKSKIFLLIIFGRIVKNNLWVRLYCTFFSLLQVLS